MVSDKVIYSLLGALSHFKDEAAGSEECKDALEKVDSLVADLRAHAEGKHAEDDNKPSFDKAGEKTKSDFFGKKKDDSADTKDEPAK